MQESTDRLAYTSTRDQGRGTGFDAFKDKQVAGNTTIANHKEPNFGFYKRTKGEFADNLPPVRVEK
jgi:hypothetical protein